MVCPYCGKEMESGVINVSNGAKSPISWLPQEVILNKTFMPVTKKGTEKLGGIALPVKNTFMLPHIDAYICKDCRKIIIDY